MDTALEAALIEMATTPQNQVIFSALDQQTLADAPLEVTNAHIGRSKTTYTLSIQAPMFPDAVKDLCRQMWDGFVRLGADNPFDLFLGWEEQEELEGFSDNPTVQKAIEALTPLSKKRDPLTKLLIDAYCLGECTAQEIRELGLSRQFTKQDLLDLFLVFIRAIRGYPRLGDPRSPQYRSRLVLLLYELEHLTSCPPHEVAQLMQALTYVMEKVGSVCTLWLNVNDTDPALPAEVRQALGRRFVSRITYDLIAH